VGALDEQQELAGRIRVDYKFVEDCLTVEDEN
jgi:hypothetical protein